MIKHTIHVDDRGKVLCEITYEDQKLFLPIELIKDFAQSLDEWIDNVLPDGQFTDEMGKVVVVEDGQVVGRQG